jgi:hypothetical protein
MSFLTDLELDNQIDLPVSAPTIMVEQQRWVIVASMKVTAPMQLVLRLLQLQLVEVVNPYTDGSVVVTPNEQGLCVFPPSDIVLDNPDYGLAYLGLYRGFIPPVAPGSQPVQEPPLIVGGVNAVAPAISVRDMAPTTYATDGVYSFVLVNNTQNRKLKLTVNGQIRMLLNPEPSI